MQRARFDRNLTESKDLGKSEPWPGMEDFAVKKKFPVEQIVTNPRQAGVGNPRAGSVLILLRATAAKSALLCLILWVVFNVWFNRERANAYRDSSTRISTGGFLGGGNGVLQSVGLAVFVSGLSPCLPQDSPKQSPMPDECSSLRESNEYRLAGEQRRIPMYVEILAGVFLCGLISWGDAVWTDGR
jgi:hypothetical protein